VKIPIKCPRKKYESWYCGTTRIYISKILLFFFVLGNS